MLPENVKGFFVVPGNTKNLKHSVSKNYLKYTQGLWGIKIISVYVAPVRGQSKLKIPVILTCSQVRATYEFESSGIETAEPLAFFELKLDNEEKKSFFFKNNDSEFHVLNSFRGHLDFEFKSDLRSKKAISIENEIKVYFCLKKLRDAH